MEGRRLTNLLAHLSSGSACNSTSRLQCSKPDLEYETHGTSEATCNKTVRVSENMHLPVVEARNMQTCRFSGLVEETLKGITSHSITSSTGRDNEAQPSVASTMQETSPLPQVMRGSILRRSERTYSHDKICIEGCRGSLSSSWSETSMPDATNHGGGRQCKSLDLAQIAIRECQVEQANQTVCSTDKNLLACTKEGKNYEARDCECQQSVEASDDSESQDMNTEESHHTTGIELGTSGSISLSRNNAMTGQRSFIVDDCVFCLIVQGQSPAFKLYEDDMCVCILDVHPLSHGHSLLIPKAHFPCLELTPPEVAAAMCAMVPLLSMAIMQATSCDSFNLLVNSGKAAGQVVFHTHFHIIPRRSGDNLWRSEDSKRRVLPVGHETSLLVQQICHHLSKQHS